MAKKKKSPRSKTRESFVLDSSTALAWCFTDENSAYADAVARKLPSLGAFVPTIWHLEVANAMVVGERRGRCDRDDTLKWTAFLASLIPIPRCSKNSASLRVAYGAEPSSVECLQVWIIPSLSVLGDCPEALSLPQHPRTSATSAKGAMARSISAYASSH